MVEVIHDPLAEVQQAQGQSEYQPVPGAMKGPSETEPSQSNVRNDKNIPKQQQQQKSSFGVLIGYDWDLFRCRKRRSSLNRNPN